MSDHEAIKVLEGALFIALREVGDRDSELELLKTQITGLQAALELANEKYAECDRTLAAARSQAYSWVMDRDLEFINRRKQIENRESEIASLKGAILTDDHILAPYYRSILDKLCDRLNLHTASAFDDLVYTVDRISIDCTQFSEGIIERDRTISNLKLELEQCERQSSINDELRSESTATLESYQNTLDALRSLFNLPLKRNYLDLPDRVQELQKWVTDYESNVNHYSETILDRDRTISILEENLDRAKSDHLEQLRAIIQMIQPLIGRPYNSTENKDGKIYVHVNHANEFTHNEKNLAIKLILKVIYANVRRLDPCIKSVLYDDDF